MRHRKVRVEVNMNVQVDIARILTRICVLISLFI